MMKTVLVTNGNLSSLLALGPFLKNNKDSISAIFITTLLPSQKNNVLGVFSMLKRSGIKYTYFKLLVNYFLPRRLKKLGLVTSVQEYINVLAPDVPIVSTPNINEPSMIKKISEIDPDILLSFSSTVRFNDDLIATPKRVAINVHYALLPGYAGLSPYFWYLQKKEKYCGVTIHTITSRLDAGPIIDTRVFSLDGYQSVMKVMLKQASLVSPILNDYYSGKISELNVKEQDLAKRSYFGHPTRNDVKKFLNENNVFYSNSDISDTIIKIKSLND